MDNNIPLPHELRLKIEQEAIASGVSVDEFVRVSLEWALAHKRSNDPLFSDHAVYSDDGPNDTARRHDEYLYGDAS